MVYVQGDNMDLLTKKVVKHRVNGLTFEEAADKIGISPEEAVRAWKHYVDNRMVMSIEEQQVLAMLRLENFLRICMGRLDECTRAEDFELVLKTYDRIEALLALNAERKNAAEDALVALTKQQSQLILSAMFAMKGSIEAHISQAFEANKTIKTIRAGVLDGFDDTFLNLAQTSLALEASSDE